MAVLKKTVLFIALAFTAGPGCVVGYLVESSYYQQKILRAREPLEEIIQSPEYSNATKDKLKLAILAKNFAVKKLGLKETDNYDTYVKLNRPYVSWVVRVSDAYQIEPYKWWFPIVGSISYKGFFSRSEAKSEAQKFDPRKYDTYVRGVTAYSTLGWFSDPILSSMMSYENYEFVELIIHESTHATLYVKSNTDFNERLATFVGRKGAQLYYLDNEGKNSPTLKIMKDEESDDKLFSNFISKEITSLKKWYKDNKGHINHSQKEERLADIVKRFNSDVKPHFVTKSYDYFSKIKINNAKLLSYETYDQDLSEFEQLYKNEGNDMKKFISTCLKFQDDSNPLEALKRLIARR